jgi:hypothetical protein
MDSHQREIISRSLKPRLEFRFLKYKFTDYFDRSTERVGVAVSLLAHIRGMLGLNLGRDIGYPEVIFFEVSLQENGDIAP